MNSEEAGWQIRDFLHGNQAPILTSSSDHCCSIAQKQQTYENLSNCNINICHIDSVGVPEDHLVQNMCALFCLIQESIGRNKHCNPIIGFMNMD